MEYFHSAETEKLFEAILLLENKEECRRLFEDLCTVKEITDMSQRLHIAQMLKQGINYQEISKKTGASTTTISRVGKCLNYGAGGYDAILKKLENTGENAE